MVVSKTDQKIEMWGFSENALKYQGRKILIDVYCELQNEAKADKYLIPRLGQR